MAALAARVAELEAKEEEAALSALLEDDSDMEMEEEPLLRIYGFADFGVQRAWSDPSSPVSNFIEANATSFVIGNLNLYFDAKPAEQWRTLIEVRFTNAPHGEVTGVGGLAGTFEREDTYQLDPHGSGLNVPMWRGSMVIERAWTEWQADQLLNVRVGNFFTPWGIWNIDHGSPTLISLQLPQHILQSAIPIRQTGIQLYGSTFAGEWQLGYHATLSNGRVDLSNYDFDDDKSFGGRLYARRETGTFNVTLGTSLYYGNQEDEVVDVVAAAPVAFEQSSTWEYSERILGLDLALDYHDFRLRTEFTARTREFEEGKLMPADPLFAPVGSFNGSRAGYWAYLILAQRLPWLGLEPVLLFDATHSEGSVGDTIVLSSLGLNVHFTPSTLLKVAYAKSFFLKLSNKALVLDVGQLSVDQVLARIVTAF